MFCAKLRLFDFTRKIYKINENYDVLMCFFVCLFVFVFESKRKDNLQKKRANFQKKVK